jgi:hypothetical protein
MTKFASTVGAANKPTKEAASLKCELDGTTLRYMMSMPSRPGRKNVRIRAELGHAARKRLRRVRPRSPALGHLTSE